MDDHNESETNEQAKAYVYFVAQAQSNFIKIGATTDVVARLKQLQTGNPQRLIIMRVIEFETIEDARWVETILHRRYRSLKLGAYGEWFAVSPLDIMEDINFALAVGEHVLGHVIRDIPSDATSQINFYSGFSEYPLVSGFESRLKPPEEVAAYFQKKWAEPSHKNGAENEEDD